MGKFINPSRNAVFKKLESIVDIAALSKEDRMKYDESIKVYRDNLAVMKCAIQEGLEEGLEKGRAEGRIEVALKMKQSNLPIDMIVEMTGLTKDEIEKL